jgi:DNA-binding XRE family transcriptional regulator|tara:strand:- start:34 stop:363 length:330 start_codon:yes stop_codon:yes gene_type:complete
MNAPTSVQIINDAQGEPAFVVIPYADYVASQATDDSVPHEVAGYVLVDELSPAAAWRRYLRLTQAEVAARIGISQAAYAQQEKAKRPRKQTRIRIAEALGIAPKMLDIV